MFYVRLDGTTLTGVSNKFETMEDALSAAKDELIYRTPETLGSLEWECTCIKGRTYKATTYCDEFDDPEGIGYWSEHEIDIFVA